MNIQTRSQRYQSSRETILATSRDVFLRHGYSDASMDTIAQRSGVSKTTLYAHFESKEALFNQVVVDVVGEHEDDTSALLEFSIEDGVREKLVTIGRRMLDMLLDPEATALIRLCVIEGARMPRLGTESLIAARANLLDLLAGFFREQAATGALAVDDPREAADLFIVLTLRDYQLQAMLPWSTVNTTEAHQRNASQVADLILRLYGRPPVA
jgi:TetR/AcrR family transcriptional regulator, mexJK operon transcriptional repressor